MKWLANPAFGSTICLGFDGSENDDWTAIKAETPGGYLFTPRYGPSRRPTIWDPAEWGGVMPRDEVNVAMAELNAKYRVYRAYCDTDPFWRSQIGDWSVEYGEKVYLEWPTNKVIRTYPALQRFAADLTTRALKHDGCPITTQHISNAKKKAQPGDKFVLMKPAGANHQKIDAAMASLLAHEAACNARADGWTDAPTVSYGFGYA